MPDDADSMKEKPETSVQEDTALDLEAGSATKPNEALHDDLNDKNKVSWDGPDDINNPLNWPAWKKLSNGALISALAFLTPLVSSFFAPSVPQLMAEFDSNNNLLTTFVVSVYVLGFAFGPLLMAPLSEVYGRIPVYHVCNVGFVAFVIACAVAPSLNSFIAFRFLSGIFGSCPLANANGSIFDIVSQERRASAIAAVTIGPLLGPIIGPVAGGFLASAKGWRWTFWVLAVVAGFLTIMMLLFMRETYAPVILARKTRRLVKETGNEHLQSSMDKGLSAEDYFKRALTRPTKMLVKSPLLLIFALYSAVMYGYLYLLFSSLTAVFEEVYGFGTNIVGLSFIGIGFGTMLALGIYARVSDTAVKRAKQGSPGPAKPEIRLLLLPVGAFLVPAGFFLYGWTAHFKVQWIVPEIGLAIIGLGNLIAFMAINMYLIDTYTIYAASALAAITVIRSTGGAILPLGALPMYDALGVGWGNSLLGFIAIALTPVPFFIIRYGGRFRERFKLVDL